jgi:hypothetical protein
MLYASFAQAKGGDRVIWTKKPGAKGLYTTKNYFVSHGVGLTAAAMYYFGDVDNEGVAFNGGFNSHNLSLGGGFTFMYNVPAGNHCNIRFGLLGGTIGGNNELKFSTLSEPRDDFRKFNAVLIQPAVGVQYYPFSRAGFYIYGGLGIAASIITKYEFYHYAKKEGQSERVRELLEGKTYGILPMLQLGIGYSFRLTESFSLSVEIMGQEGIVDQHYMNLDAYPLAKSQNSQNVEMGGTSGKWVDKEGKEHMAWNDGWFQAGITLTYHWRNCEYCRMINNYHNAKPSRHYSNQRKIAKRKNYSRKGMSRRAYNRRLRRR